MPHWRNQLWLWRDLIIFLICCIGGLHWLFWKLWRGYLSYFDYFVLINPVKLKVTCLNIFFCKGIPEYFMTSLKVNMIGYKVTLSSILILVLAAAAKLQGDAHQHRIKHFVCSKYFSSLISIVDMVWMILAYCRGGHLETMLEYRLVIVVRLSSLVIKAQLDIYIYIVVVVLTLSL